MDEVRRNWISGLMEYGVGVITCYLVIGYQPMKRYIEACFGGRCRLIKSQCCFLNGNVWFSKISQKPWILEKVTYLHTN